jgi:Uma2 family endonuclease
MPAALAVHSAQLPADARRRLTRADCQALEAAGLLEGERFELIDGELICKTPKSRLHSIVLHLLHRWLRQAFGDDYVEQEVSIDLGPLLTPTNQPEPDAIVLRRPFAEFRTQNPAPPDLLLVVEVSATTQEYDLGAKAALYASACIPDYWVVDLRNHRIVIHRDPADDRYNSIIAYAADEPVSPLAAEAATLRLQDLLS